MQKNHLYVANFTSDNNIGFFSTPKGYTITDLSAGVCLFQGPCKDGIYPITMSQTHSSS